MAVHFFSEDIPFQLAEKLRRKRWLKELAATSGFQIKELNYVFCSDEYLFQMNVDYLNHDTYTDIITFDFSTSDTVSGDLYISSDRVRDNALKNKNEIQNETYLVIIHGVMHLCGYKDKTKSEALTMRKKEENSLLKIQEYISV